MPARECDELQGASGHFRAASRALEPRGHTVTRHTPWMTLLKHTAISACCRWRRTGTRARLERCLRRQRAPVYRVHHEPVHERVRAGAAARDAGAAEVEAEAAGDEHVTEERECGLHTAEQRDERGGRGEQVQTVRTVAESAKKRGFRRRRMWRCRAWVRTSRLG